MALWTRIRLGTMRLRVRFLALLSGLRIRCCGELWCRSQIRLGSGTAVAVVWAGSCSSDQTPSLGTATCHRCGPKKTKKKEKKKKKFCDTNSDSAPIPAVFPTIQLNSDALYPDIASDLTT